MVENDSQLAVETSEEAAEPDFDHLTGIITDGFIGAVGGLVGTAAMTVVLLMASTVDAFHLGSFAALADLTGLHVVFPAHPTAVGYLVFLAGGMVIWPLLFASIGSYLPGKKYATKGISYGFVLWTGFAMAFYSGYEGTVLALYLPLTLIGHFAYGFSLGAVFDYLSSRPDTLV